MKYSNVKCFNPNLNPTSDLQVNLRNAHSLIGHILVLLQCFNIHKGKYCKNINKICFQIFCLTTFIFTGVQFTCYAVSCKPVPCQERSSISMLYLFCSNFAKTQYLWHCEPRSWLLITFFCARWKKKLFWRYKLWLSWKQCDFSLALSYVGGPNMWVSKTDHSDCICCHDMREIVNSNYFLFPEEWPYGQASFLPVQSSNWVVWFGSHHIRAQR